MEVDKALHAFCFMTKNTLQNQFLKLEQGDIEKIEMAVGRTLKYLDTHQLGTNLSKKDQLEAKKKELEGIVNPIMMKVILSSSRFSAEEPPRKLQKLKAGPKAASSSLGIERSWQSCVICGVYRPFQGMTDECCKTQTGAECPEFR